MSREFSSNAIFVGGNTGEGIVKDILEYGKFKYYHDVFLKDSNGNITQIDFLVVTDKSLICIEVKNYSKCVIKGDDNSTCWTACYRSGNRQFLNPIKQNKIHAKMCMNVLGNVPIYNIVAFSSSCGIRIEPTNEENTRVINITDLWYELIDIKNTGYRKLNKDIRNEIINKLDDFVTRHEELYNEHQLILAKRKRL